MIALYMCVSRIMVLDGRFFVSEEVMPGEFIVCKFVYLVKNFVGRNRLS